MAGIIPLASNNAVNYNSATVQNAELPDNLTLTCDYLAIPSNCQGRITPAQINAFVSEMLNLAACFNPGGVWDCNILNNLCVNFQAFVESITPPEFPVAMAGLGNGSIGQIISDDVETILLYDNVDLSLGVTYSAGKFTVPQAGIWSITARANATELSVKEQIIIRVNGSFPSSSRADSPTNQGKQVSTAVNIRLSAGDQVWASYIHKNATGTPATVTIDGARLGLVFLGT